MSLKAIVPAASLVAPVETSQSVPEAVPPWRGRPGGAPASGLRVLMVVESSAGGTGRHVLDLCEGLVRKGCEVHLIYSTGRIDRMFLDRLAKVDGLISAPLAMKTSVHPSDARVVRDVRYYMRKFGPFDAIHGHSSKGGAIARLAAPGTGARAFYTLHGFIIMDPGLALWKRAFYLSIEVGLGLISRNIIAVSPEEARSAVRLGLGQSRVALVPNGIGPIELRSRESARRELGIPENATVVGFVGRLVDQKAPDVLLRGFAQACEAVPAADLRLAMVGAGPLGDALRQLAAELGVGDRVLWLGERDARGVLAAFDVFALSSRKEGLPYVVIEAMAAGLPVVATAASGVEILVETGTNGAVVPNDDANAFGQALTALAADRPRAREQGEASRRRARAFSIEAMVDRTLRLYQGRELPAWSPAHTPPTSDDPLRHETRDLAASFKNPDTDGGPAVAPAAKPKSAELHPGPGFRVRTDVTRLDPALMREFRDYATPDISDLLNRLYAVNPQIRCLTGPEHSVCGPACTVKVFPGDNLMVHKSLDVARPGDVVVVDAGGATTNAVLGDLISAKAKHRGVSGFVIDGLVRDLPSITELDFPVFARGTTPIGPLHRGPGEINFPICCGGIVVNPGDLIVGDAAGVIVVPKEIAAELLARLKAHREANESYLAAVRRGEFSNAWVDRVLEQQGCPVIEEPRPSPEEWAGDVAWPVAGLEQPLPDITPRATR